MGLYYNGYSPNERSRRNRAVRKERRLGKNIVSNGPCDICGDPEGPYDYHAEDCSWPYKLNEFCLCRVCHRQKLHRRFSSQHNWTAFCAHVRRGGYGRDINESTFKAELKLYQQSLKIDTKPKPLRSISGRKLKKGGWWERMTCDREVLARFDSRNRANEDILRALQKCLINLTPVQIKLIKAHYTSKDYTCSISDLAKKMKSKNWATINTAYRNMARTICDKSEYDPPVHGTKSPDWLTVIAHRNPNQSARATEWVMNESFRRAIKRLSII